MLRLSHSSLETYKQCGQKYYLHYIEKYRSPFFDSPLFFGKIVDDVVGRVLLDKKKELTEAEKKEMLLSYMEILEKKINFVEINGKEVNAFETDLIRYFKSDFDISIFTKEDFYKLEEKSTRLGIEVKTKKQAVEFHKEAFEVLKSCKLSAEENELYNFLVLTSLRRKTIMFVEAFMLDIMPSIQEVHSLQKEINLPGYDDDRLVGFIDFEATFTDGVRRIVDIKTSSRKYDQDAVKKSQQLALYSEFSELPHCGFIVFEKTIKIKEPRVSIQVLFDVIEEKDKLPIFDKIYENYDKIRNKDFTKNEDSCYAYGRKCQFYGLCHNNDTSDLIKQEKK